MTPIMFPLIVIAVCLFVAFVGIPVVLFRAGRNVGSIRRWYNVRIGFWSIDPFHDRSKYWEFTW